MDPACVILSAGAASRLGTPKALAPLPGGTPLERLVAATRGLLPARPLVVTGAHHAEIAARAPADCDLLWNPRWREGRSGGLALARRLLPRRDLLVAPVDVPLVARETFVALLAAWREAGAPPRGWLAPRLRVPPGRHGHPVLLGRELAAGLEDFGPDTPLVELRGRAEPLLEVLVDDRAILDDLDTPEDLLGLIRRIEGASG